MTTEAPAQGGTAAKKRIGDYLATGGIIASHSLQHLYGEGFYVVLPVIYTALELTPVTAGFIGTVRQISSGFSSMVGVRGSGGVEATG